MCREQDNGQQIEEAASRKAWSAMIPTHLSSHSDLPLAIWFSSQFLCSIEPPTSGIFNIHIWFGRIYWGKKHNLHNIESCFFCNAKEPGGLKLGLGWWVPGHQCPRLLHLVALPFLAFWLMICISVRRCVNYLFWQKIIARKDRWVGLFCLSLGVQSINQVKGK